MRRRLSALLTCLLVAGSLAGARADLKSYLAAPDPSYKWQKTLERKSATGVTYELRLTSQTWQGIVWTHKLLVVVPAKLQHPGIAALHVTGGNGGMGEAMLALTLAARTGAIVAVLYGVPNQPLFGGKQEDDLIAYTFERYLATGDETWPLLFPMTKSVLRAMDALQEFSKKEGMTPLDRFIVNGASKRGWTTWLTAASGDKRVVAIIPIVYDNLNIPKQMPHQLEVWGAYSAQIDDYTRRGLQARMSTPAGRKLTAMIDPYTYRKAFTMPKLIVNGTNDPYWAQDALNLYWDDLPGPKWLLYSPNSGHGLENIAPVINAASGFVQAIASGTLPPAVHWKREDTDAGARITVTCTPPATSATLWTARAATRDFRKSHWEPTPLTPTADGFVANVPRPESGALAAMVEVQTEVGGHPCPFSTQIVVLGAR